MGVGVTELGAARARRPQLLPDSSAEGLWGQEGVGDSVSSP